MSQEQNRCWSLKVGGSATAGPWVADHCLGVDHSGLSLIILYFLVGSDCPQVAPAEPEDSVTVQNRRRKNV